MTEEISRESGLALGHFLTLLRPPAYNSSIEYVDLVTPVNLPGWTELRFQNFWINETARWRDPEFGIDQDHLFLPFGFSGISVNRSGDNVDTQLVFPKNPLSMAFSSAAVNESWTVVVRVVWVQNLTNPQDPPTMLHRYEGQVSGATWEDTTISFTCNSVLDAVAANVPARSLQQLLVGNVPFTGQISLK